MPSLQRLWQAVEEIPGLQAAYVEWRSRVGDALELVQPLLLPLDRIAMSIPVPSEPERSLRVVQHAPDDYVGVHDGDGTTVTLAKRDLLVYRLDHQRVAREAAAALGIEFALHSFDGAPHVYRVGAFRPIAGLSFPTYLAFPIESHDLQRALEAIMARHDEPFILAAPTGRYLRPPCEQLLRARGACFLPLNECIALDGEGRFAATEIAQGRLAELQQAAVPHGGDAVGRVFFPTPPGATWQDVRIKFVDGETVSIQVAGARGIFTYSQLGMADGRNAKPTKQWEFLIALAGGNGVMTWSNPQATRKNQKRREMLAANLKEFFRIDGEPIEYVEECKGWRTLFTIEPDA